MSRSSLNTDRQPGSTPTGLSCRLLEGFHVLVVEDDFYQCDALVGCLNDAGGIVVGPAGSLKDAMPLAVQAGINAAILDIDLGDGPSFELALHLRRSGVPFLFVTGYKCGDVPPELGDVDCLEKPFVEHELLQATVRAVGGAAL